MFEKFKKLFKQGLCTESMVRNALSKGVITEDQLKEILGL